MKKIIWTCDTEIGELGNFMDDAYDVLVFGNIQDREIGIRYMNRMAQQFGAKLTHFVDVYQPLYKKKIIAACECILSAGHKIALHTHPSTMYGKRYMWQYSLSEQQRIIEYGQEFFFRYLNTEICCHRAGGYGADVNTMLALQKAGIYKDSSYYNSNIMCKLPFKNVNGVFRYEKMLEIPLTVYKLRKTIFGRDIFKRYSIQKLDFRYGSSVDEILKVIDKLDEDAVVILFLHSFNFIDLKYSMRGNRFTSISINDKLIKDYQILLTEISKRKDCCWETIDNISKEYYGNEIVLSKNIDICQSLKKRFSNEIYV